jgi:RNA polymerase sigma factor for flagellar operon FliA
VTVEALAAATGLTADEVADTLAAERFAKMTSWEQAAEAGGAEAAASGASAHAEVERWEMTQQLTEAIEALPPNERLAVTLYYREDLRLKEISEVMSLSVSRVSRILTKATFELGETLRARLGMGLSAAC